MTTHGKVSGLVIQAMRHLGREGVDQKVIDQLNHVLDNRAKSQLKAGRIIVNGFPTGVEVCHSMVHSGTLPATTDSRSTSVGTTAITRFARRVCYQNHPEDLLPAELQDQNPVGTWCLVDDEYTRGTA